MNPRHAILALALILAAVLFVVKGREPTVVNPHLLPGHDCADHGPEAPGHHPEESSTTGLPSKSGERPVSRSPKVITTASGLQYQVLVEGTGPRPGPNDRVQVHYVGELPDGTVFDSSRARGAPNEFSLNSIIKGWAEGLQLMRSGGTYRFTIPPELAYGEQGAGDTVPPNATLVFEVELLEVVKP
jgi:FKBP-type peptidyl-prolyl cis-trans isomerase